MKNLLYLVLLTSGLLKAQDSLTVKIANWKDNKKAAVVFTFDDWSPGHGAIVYPLFKKNSLPATFFVTTKNKDFSGGYATMKKAFDDGFEIGNHTSTHPDLSKLSPEELHTEVTQTQYKLRKNVHPKCANTLAYPFGVFTPKVIAKTKNTHIGARLANLSYGRMWKYSLTYGRTDYFQLQAFMARDIHTPDMYNRLTKSATKQGGMIVFMYHSIFNDSIDDHWFGAISEHLLEAQLKAVKKHEDSVWVTTFEKALMYHKEKSDAKISCNTEKNMVIVKLNSTLDSSLYFEPLTVKLEGIKSENIKAVSIKSSGEKINFSELKLGNGIKFNSSPYNQEIIIEL